jgi:L-ascorbate metabolism protein UlaG (beta-lactamase superfamily)
MRLIYFGHSAFQITTGGTTILVDPFITGNVHATGIVTPEDLNPDVILLTHAHGDHWGDTMEIASRSGAVVVGNFEVTQYVQQQGHGPVQPMNTGGSWRWDWGSVKQTYARHSSSFPDGTYGGNPNGYLIYAEDKCVYALGDTCPFAEMAWIGEENDIDVALVPVGDCFTMGPDDSLRAVRMLGPGRVVPVHYNTFPPIEIDIDAWAETIRGAGFTPAVLKAGEGLDV